MGKITKTMQPKHEDSLSPWLKSYVKLASEAPLPLLPGVFDRFPSRWPFPRGDLYHWIPLLNRFDDILEAFCKTYDLDKGPQMRDFGSDILLGKAHSLEYHDDVQQWNMDRLAGLNYGQDGDRQLLVAILKFTRMLLEHCGNRSIYASSAHLNDLLNSTSLDVVRATLEVGVELAQRYQASVKRMGPSPARQVSMALLANHYNIDLEKVQSLAQPFVKTPLFKISDPAPATPASASKGKEKAHFGGPKNVAPMYANDLVSLATPDQAEQGRWNGWGDIKIVYYPQSRPQPDTTVDTTTTGRTDRAGPSSVPSTPTPLRRSTTFASHHTPRSARQNAADDSSPLHPRTPATAGHDEASSQSHRILEVPQSVVASTSIYELLGRCPPDMPKASRYEYLNRLRISKALLGSPETRQEALAVRLLAIDNLAFIYNETTFVEKVLRQDNDEPRRYQLVYQLAELIHPSADGSVEMPLWLQTVAFALLQAISNIQIKHQDVLSALNANVNHGVLLYVVRKAVAGMKEDVEGESEGKETVVDAWRNQLLSLTLHMAMTSRHGQEMISAGLMEALIEILNLRTKIAARIQSTVLAFLDGLVTGFQGAFQSFSNPSGLDSIAQLIIDTVSTAKILMDAQQGTSSDFHSHVVDYGIPFYQQQTLKWLLKFIHHIMMQFYSFGGNTDRILRNMVDNSQLLGGLREVIVNKQVFGSVVWTNATLCLGDFINNDPTSFTAILESGMIKGFLETLTGRQVTVQQAPAHPSQLEEPSENNDAPSPADTEDSVDLSDDDRQHPPPEDVLEEPRERPPASGILPSAEAIGCVPAILNSISLNSTGMRMVVSCRALDSFMEIFESPEHIRCADQDHDLFHTLGNSIDELARHHPALRPAISNAILDMVARMVYFAYHGAVAKGWGTKLVVKDPEGNVIAVEKAFDSKARARSSKGKQKATSDEHRVEQELDGDIEMIDANPGPVDDGTANNGTDSGGMTSINPYISALMIFLEALVANTNLKNSLIQDGIIQLLLKLSEAPSLPANFPDSRAWRMLSSTVAQLIQHSPIIGVPPLLRRIQDNVTVLEPVVREGKAHPFFAPFLETDLVVAKEDGEWDQVAVKKLAEGTRVVRALLNAQTLIRTLYQCFPYGRSSSPSMPAVNVYDYLTPLVKSLGPLLCSGLTEEMAIANLVPQHWPNRKSLGIRGHFPDIDIDLESPAIDGADAAAREDVQLSDVPPDGAIPNATNADQTSGSKTKPTPEEQTSPRFQNYQTIKTLLHSLMPTVVPFFQTVGKALLPRRDRDPYTRYHHMEIAEALADTLLELLKQPSARETGQQEAITPKDLHYWAIMLHTIQDTLLDPNPRGERQAVHVILPVLAAFKERGGIEALNTLLQHFADNFNVDHDEGEEWSKRKIAAMGMTKILDVYVHFAQGRNITDSLGQINLVPHRPSGGRSDDRRPELGHIGSQLVVELRMSVLPVVRKLWESPIVEKTPPLVLAKVIEILKAIFLGDQEQNAPSRSDGNARALVFKQDPVPFNWAVHLDVLKDVTEKFEAGKFDEGLAIEAIYRANGRSEDAQTYIRAYLKGAIGRHPIPEQDAYRPDASRPSDAASPGTPAVPSQSETFLHRSGFLRYAMDINSLPNIDRMIDNELDHVDAVPEAGGENPSIEPNDHSDDSADSPMPQVEAEPASANPEAGMPSSSAREAPATVTKDDLDDERAALRKDIIDRCLDVIRAHPDCVFEVAELIKLSSLKSGDEHKLAEVGEILANALMSFAIDDEVKKSSGRSIAAYAHLLSLLLQDKAFYQASLKTLKDNIGEYIGFLQLPPTSSNDELPPWIPYVLLIFETLLADDEQPLEVKWKGPTSENDPIEEPVIQEREKNISASGREAILEATLTILPRIGKDENLATSVLRILVILTRERDLAKRVGEKKNLQRLFVMAKQLCGADTIRLRNSRVSRSILIVLRHIVEDEETIRQIMQAEIKTYMVNGSKNPRTLEIYTFLRSLAHVALRSPPIFVEVASEMLKLNRWVPSPSQASEGSGRSMNALALKEQPLPRDAEPSSDVSVEPAVQGTEDLTINDVKQSTEGGDKEMVDVPKTPASELKRPILENPDGVIHFLLCELLNYRDVEDKELSLHPAQESKPEAESSTAESSTSLSATLTPAAEVSPEQPVDGKEKKSTKPTFKTEEHPIFVYRCFLFHCLSELLQSYNRAKVEFINFKRSAPVLAGTPIKPRSSVLNYILHDLLFTNNSQPAESIGSKKKVATATQAQQVLVALVAKTGEKPTVRNSEPFQYDDEPELLFVRRFVLDTILKAYKETSSSSEHFDVRISKMSCLAELMQHMIGEKDKDVPNPRGTDPAAVRSQAQIKRLMYEKGYLAALTASLADLDLTLPNVKRTIKYILRVLKTLSRAAIQLSNANLVTSALSDTNADDEVLSASSLSDMDEDREETPDLYRNSALGMMEPAREDDFSDDSEDEDEEMYDDEFGDEMDYGDEVSEDNEEDVSDEDEELGDMGPIEGLPGAPVAVEVIMGEHDDDDDEEDDDDDMDEDDDDEDDDDDDEVGSEDLDDIQQQIEIVDEEGNPVGDDGQSGWTSDTDEEEGDDDEDEIDYEAEAQDLDEAGIENRQLRFGNAMRAAMDPDDIDVEDLAFDERYIDDGLDGLDEEEDDQEDIDDFEDDELYYDQDLPLGDEAPLANMPAGLGWDTLVLDHGNHRHTRHPGMPSPFHPFSRRTALGEMRYVRSHGRHAGHAGNHVDDGANPLLRRDNGPPRGWSPRPANSFRLGLPGLMGSAADGPLALIEDLVNSLPHMPGHTAHALHFQITQQGPSGLVREINIPLAPPRGHESRSDGRRDLYMEPSVVVAFTPIITVERWQEEARMIFGNSFTDKANKFISPILARLVPPAIEHEKAVKAWEAKEKRLREEERKKREEEERKQREAKEAEEKALQEKLEAEERERAEREAAEAAAQAEVEAEAQSQAEQDDDEPQAMEGVETASDNDESGGGPSTAAPRVVTTIRGETVDVTELGIDPDYLAALPEEFREEVIAQTVSSRRQQARQTAESAGETTETFQEFLEALPEDLRQEIIQQERQERRRRDRDEQRRQAAATGQDVGSQDMDPASILLTFPPELREQVLMEQGDELMEHLTPDMAAEARAIAQRHGAIPQRQGGMRAPQEWTGGRGGPSRTAQASGANDTKPQRRAVVQILDKAGVATLLRLMFVAQQGTIRNNLFDVFTQVCENRLNRLEVISTLLQILQDGTTDMDAVERSFNHLSVKAKQLKDRDPSKTPVSIKRTLTTIGPHPQIQTNSEVSPLLVLQQCLDLLVQLSTVNPHVPSLFLTEHETVASMLKRSNSRKGKGKELNVKAHKYAINSLLGLLDRNLVMESSAVMQLLADLLNKVTYPLQAFERRRREAEEEAKKKQEKSKEQGATDAEAAAGSSEQAATEMQTEQTTASAAPTEGHQVAVEEDSTNKEGHPAEDKKPRQLTPPTIPESNLMLVTNIFVARECSSKTFQNTISTIKNLSNIPGANRVFGEELVRQARVLSENIVSDLDDLLPHIMKAESGTQIQGVALAKFSPGASEQNKLLRVLTALDHLFDKKSKKSDEDDSAGTNGDLLGSLYVNPTFATMWDKLSACLAAIRQRENMLNVATILLPLIESLMVVCKNTTNDASLAQSLASKEMLLSSPPPEDRFAGLFFNFTEEHRRILNELVRSNPKLMSGTFSLLVKNPKVLEFDNKRNYFTRSVHSKSRDQQSRDQQSRPTYSPLQLSVRRDHVFHDSFKSLYFKSGDEMKYGKLNIRFHGEEGVDAGGVTREWFQVLSRQMFDPNYCLFIPVSSDRTTFHPNKVSAVNEEHLLFFKFIGRVIGKALYEGRVLDCYFSRAVYKRILGKPVSVKDMESFDPEYYKSLDWILKNNIEGVLCETFSVEENAFGVATVVDLVPNGRDIPLTEENKHDYVRLVVEHKLLTSVKYQMEEFLKGFHDIIPAELIAIFNEQELELLISGLPDIDVDDWKAHTEYHNYTAASPQIQWFWRAVRSFDKEERAKLLQFVTGTSKVPLNGFKELEGMNGISRFNIHRDYGNKERLPSSHTCFNQLDLPEYETYDILRSRILKAITAGSDYFGFA